MTAQSQFHIPIVDISGALAGDAKAKSEAVNLIREACQVHGFFYVTGHGVPLKLINEAFAASAKFYAIPDEQKTDCTVNASFRGHMPLKFEVGINGVKQAAGAEIYTIGYDLAADDPSVLAGEFMCAPNVWPQAMPEFRDLALRYYQTLGELGTKVLRLVAAGLGIREDFFDDKYNQHTAQLVFLHYPPIPENAPKDAVSGQEHTDWGVITLLVQDDCGGLRLRDRSTNQWVDAPPVADSFIVNLADLMARWTNDRYVSTPHQVVNRARRDRYSIGYFYNPDSSVVVDPKELGVSAAESRYPPITSGEYVRARWAEFYDQSQKGEPDRAHKTAA